MKACGVIAEYNPFHNGHKYQLKTARQKSQADVMIVAMSGNFLQRGEPAVIDKWTRSEAALKNGADLVVELPLHWSLQAADFFAQGGVSLLAALGCSSLAFGTDEKNDFDYPSFGRYLKEHPTEIDLAYKNVDRPELTYAQKMAVVFSQLLPDFSLTKDQPNHVLGMTYAQENARLERPMTLLPIQRLQVSHHSLDISGEIASATAIRRALQQGGDIKALVPPEMSAPLQRYQIKWDHFWPLLRYQILCTSTEELGQIYQMVEGLEYRLKKKILTATSFDTYVEAVKSKRYSRTRIQRLLTYVLLNIRDAEMKNSWQEDYLHLLGFSQKGQRYLRQIKKKLALPLVTNVGRQEAERYALNVKADNIYQLGNSKVKEQNFGRFPNHVI